MNDDSLNDTSEVIPANLRSLGATILPFKATTPAAVTPEVTPSDQNTPNPSIVKLFEDYLAKAKSGEITFVGIATVNQAGVGHSTWFPEDETTPQLITSGLGAIAYLNARFGRACEEGADFGFSDDPPPNLA